MIELNVSETDETTLETQDDEVVELSASEVGSAIPKDIKEQIEANTAARHTHSNMTELDKLADGDVSKIAEAYDAKHTHDNLDELNKIASGDTEKLATAYSQAHEHSNKSTLDAITDDKVTAWDGKADTASVEAAAKDASDALDKINALNTQLSVMSNIEVAGTIANRGLTADGNSYDTGSGNALYKYTVVAGQELYLKVAAAKSSASRGDNVGSYQFQNTDQIRTSGAASRLVGNVTIGAFEGFVTVPEGAVCLIVSKKDSVDTNVVAVSATKTESDKSLSLDGAFADARTVGERISKVEDLPMVILGVDHEFKDLTDVYPTVSYSTAIPEKGFVINDLATEDDKLVIKETTITGATPFSYAMEQVYSRFNELCVKYPDYITRVDAASVVGLEYPDYANGITEQTTTDGGYTYEVTPAYKTYMYKLECSNICAGNGTYNKKKKMLIISGVHGKECFAPFNTYILAKNLCEATDANFFKLRSAYDVYIIPCVNGYGLHHGRRWNAHDVDLNRNYPIAKWKETTKGTDTYSGPSAASEFETQVVTAITEAVSPDVAIDHHNYFDEHQQFMAAVGKDEQLRLVHQALVDCSLTYIKEMPEYFGTSYRLFIESRSSYEYAPKQSASETNGTAVRWWHEFGTSMSSTIEICNKIKYKDGAVKDSDSYTQDALTVAEYELRSLVMRYAQYVLGGSVTNSTSYSDGSGVSY